MKNNGMFASLFHILIQNIFEMETGLECSWSRGRRTGYFRSATANSCVTLFCAVYYSHSAATPINCISPVTSTNFLHLLYPYYTRTCMDVMFLLFSPKNKNIYTRASMLFILFARLKRVARTIWPRHIRLRRHIEGASRINFSPSDTQFT
jgi:hypothetical protein